MVQLQRNPLHDHIDALCRLMAALGLVAVQAKMTTAGTAHDMRLPTGVGPQIMVAAAIEVGGACVVCVCCITPSGTHIPYTSSLHSKCIRLVKMLGTGAVWQQWTVNCSSAGSACHYCMSYV